MMNRKTLLIDRDTCPCFEVYHASCGLSLVCAYKLHIPCLTSEWSFTNCTFLPSSTHES